MPHVLPLALCSIPPNAGPPCTWPCALRCSCPGSPRVSAVRMAAAGGVEVLVVPPTQDNGSRKAEQLGACYGTRRSHILPPAACTWCLPGGCCLVGPPNQWHKHANVGMLVVNHCNCCACPCPTAITSYSVVAMPVSGGFNVSVGGTLGAAVPGSNQVRAF